MHRSKWTLVAVALVAASTLVADDLPEYVSENTATSVRPPLGEEVPIGELLGSITRDELHILEPYSSSDVARLIELEGETLRVHSVVQSTFIPEGGSPVILNFDEEHRECFKVVVYRRNYDHWGREAVEIAELYEGADVLVEGTVSLYEGLPQIEVMAPTQIRRVVDE